MRERERGVMTSSSPPCALVFRVCVGSSRLGGRRGGRRDCALQEKVSVGGKNKKIRNEHMSEKDPSSSSSHAPFVPGFVSWKMNSANALPMSRSQRQHSLAYGDSISFYTQVRSSFAMESIRGQTLFIQSRRCDFLQSLGCVGKIHSLGHVNK